MAFPVNNDDCVIAVNTITLSIIAVYLVFKNILYILHIHIGYCYGCNRY